MHMKQLALSAALFTGAAIAHPGHDITHEIAERRSFLSGSAATSLSHCLPRFVANGLEARNSARRAAQVAALRKKRGLPEPVTKRDADEVLGKSHNSTDLGYTPITSPDTLFAGINSCVLTPEVTQGPYYVSGEDIRYNVVEDQEGVGIILDYQVIDVETCDPVPDAFVEIWHCNSTGVYSGVTANGNGNTDDADNIDATFLRGIQQTDDDGVAQFESLFPGHYTGRTPHIHILVHTNATLYKNNTLGNLVYASHVGQAFFDQDLITDVEKTSPYTDNTQDLTLNADDGILAQEAETDGVDPLMQYTLLGNGVGEGLFAWLAFGINTTYSSETQPAVFRYKEGGVENPNSGGGGPGGPGGPPNSTASPAPSS